MLGQKVIQMESDGGVYKIPCKVNGAKMKMIFDTGAASVTISLNMAEYLYENDYITKEDILGKGQSQTASGDIVDHVIINLRDIEISDIHLKNVKAVVLSSQNSPLLLGLTAIKQLGPVTIEGNRLIINKYNDKELSDEEKQKFAEDAENFYQQKKYYAAIELYLKLRDNPGLSTIGYSRLISSYNETGQYNLAMSLFEEWENGSENKYASDLEKLQIYTVVSLTCIFADDQQFRIHVEEGRIALKQKIGLPIEGNDYSGLADTYENLNDIKSSIYYRKKAINQYLLTCKNSVFDIYNGKISDPDTRHFLGMELYRYALVLALYYDYKNPEMINYLIKGAAKCGDQLAIDFCRKIGINYRDANYRPQYSYLFSSY